MIVVTECNTEKTLAEKLLKSKCPDISECILHPRYGIGKALQAFSEQVSHTESTENPEHEIIGLIADLERGKIQEKKVRQVINKIFQGIEPIVIYSHNDKRIILFMKYLGTVKVFSLLFDPWFEEVMSEISQSFRKLYDEMGNTIKRAVNQERLQRILDEEPARAFIKKTEIFVFNAQTNPDADLTDRG